MKHSRFLISRPDRIGDVVLSTPFPREIKKHSPGSYVAMLVTEYTKDIFLHNPYVDELITFPPQGQYISAAEFFTAVKELRHRNFDTAFMLLPAERVNYLLFLTGIPLRIGVGHKFYQFITNTKSVYRRKYKPLKHESDYCLDMLRKIDINPGSINPEIYLSEKEQVEIGRIRRELSSDTRRIIGINSTSGGSAPNLEVREYRKLIDLLLSDGQFHVAVTDYLVPAELDNINAVSYICRGLPLRRSIVNFASLDMLVSASTGPMHISAALKVPTLSLFCPMTACSPELWGPLGNAHIILLPKKDYCSINCPGDPKKCNFSGEGGIDADMVFNKIKEYFAEK